jgi:N-acetylmuramoyl-L-alanine amidase
MRKITRIVFHCSAARPGAASSQTAATIDAMHKRERGWRKIGYQRFVRTDGTDERGRADDEVGAGVFGFNANSIHVCYAGGLDLLGRPADTRTPQQLAALRKIAQEYHKKYPDAKFCGHRDLSPDKDGDGVVEKHEWMKDCPCFDVAAWIKEVL